MRITAICLLLWVSSALAWAGSLQGTVKDSQGHPVKGAEVRIESKKFVKTIATDAKGHYLCDGLTAGTDYKVTVVVNGSVKASILNTRTGAGKPTELNFDLRQAQAKASPKKHLVWIPLETGTHIGSSGHWVEVDDKGQVVNDNPDLIKAGSDYSRQLQLSGSRRPPGN